VSEKHIPPSSWSTSKLIKKPAWSRQHICFCQKYPHQKTRMNIQNLKKIEFVKFEHFFNIKTFRLRGYARYLATIFICGGCIGSSELGRWSCICFKMLSWSRPWETLVNHKKPVTEGLALRLHILEVVGMIVSREVILTGLQIGCNLCNTSRTRRWIIRSSFLHQRPMDDGSYIFQINNHELKGQQHHRKHTAAWHWINHHYTVRKSQKWKPMDRPYCSKL
jgi:hypothetical protein